LAPLGALEPGPLVDDAVDAERGVRRRERAPVVELDVLPDLEAYLVAVLESFVPRRQPLDDSTVAVSRQ
jgi:hypothetical protein